MKYNQYQDNLDTTLRYLHNTHLNDLFIKYIFADADDCCFYVINIYIR